MSWLAFGDGRGDVFVFELEFGMDVDVDVDVDVCVMRDVEKGKFMGLERAWNE